MNVTAIRVHLARVSALLFTLAGIAMAADQPGICATLQGNGRLRRSLH